MITLQYKKSLPNDILFVLLIAAFYCGAIEINNHLLFHWLEDRPFRYWIYLPAGLKLFLVMMFGVRALCGISIGLAVSMLSTIAGLSLFHALLIGLGSGISVFLSVYIFSYVTQVTYPWNKLQFYHIPLLAFFSALLNSVVAYEIYRYVGLEDPFDWQSDIFIDVTGRFIGTFVFVYAALFIRKNFFLKA